MKHFFDYATRQIKAADTAPALLTSAFVGLDLIERATTVLTQTAPKDAHQTALAEATDAWWALAEAPTLGWPERSMTDTDIRLLADAVAAFVMAVAEAILTAASKTTDPADRVACLTAAHHAGHIHAALGRRP
ncbi:hypothetical protein [Actinomadura sp. 7K507]|uniref:hypothetical protein n=1 Tax=Actinomadura sp. 7K507 TaxID=2530365 RepID=UPI00104741AE|nr:hypothetical protein [Actinomadura sp. 7K507]TDC73851.1 hypothetical protein E1285_44180 [Actinomadura sp. 7K507]